MLAGGFGTRIKPLSFRVPKPMLPVMNRPMLDHVLANLAPLGCDEIVFFLYFLPEKIQSYYQKRPLPGARYHFVLPDNDYGTAGTIAFASHLLTETFVVVSGDVVTDIDLRALVEAHQRTGAMATMALTSVANPLQYGVVIVDDKGRVKSFLEKPGWGEVITDTVNTGIYVLEPEVLTRIPRGKGFDFSRDLFPLLLAEKKLLLGHQAEGYWRDVGNPDAYRSVHDDLFSRRFSLSIPGRRVELEEGEAWLDEGAEISPKARVSGMVVLGPRVRLPRGYYCNTVFGPGCEVGEGCSIEDSVLWEGVRVGARSKVRRAVLCEEVRLGEDVRIPAGAVIAAGDIIQDRVTIERDLTLGPDKVVEAGSVLSASLSGGERWRGSLFEANHVAGRTNSEMSPSLCARLGEAFGSVLPQGRSILVSRDYHKASRMLKRAFLGGVLGSGVNARDLRLVPEPVIRFHLAASKAAGGVHFRQRPDDPEATDIIFYDANGFPLGEDQIKKVESAFSREEFRRPAHDQVGVLEEVPAALESYRERFLAALDREPIRARRFSLVLDLAHGASAEVLPQILEQLGCRAVVLNAHREESHLAPAPDAVRASLTRVGKIVRSLKADLGAYLFPSGARLVVVDEKGHPRQDFETLLLILSLMGKGRTSPAKVFLPANTPRDAISRLDGVEPVAGRLTRLRPKAVSSLELIGSLRGRFAFPRFASHWDGLYALARVLELLARAERPVAGSGPMPLSEAYARLPLTTFLRTHLACTMECKGVAMRAFREAAKGAELSFEEGIRADYPWGWVLLVPDQHASRVNLYVEARRPADARRALTRWHAILQRALRR